MDVLAARDVIVFQVIVTPTEYSAIEREVNEYTEIEEGPDYPAAMDLAHKLVRSR